MKTDIKTIVEKIFAEERSVAKQEKMKEDKTPREIIVSLDRTIKQFKEKTDESRGEEYKLFSATLDVAKKLKDYLLSNDLKSAQILFSSCMDLITNEFEEIVKGYIYTGKIRSVRDYLYKEVK